VAAARNGFGKVSMSSLTSSTTARAPSLAHELEQRRLRHRAARIRRALRALHHLAETRADGAPAPLQHGIRDFQRELDAVERRLRDLERAPGAR